jgi:hypothetical protein
MPPELVPKGAENYRPVITYRPSLAPLQVLVGAGFAVVGLAMALAPSRAGVAGVVIGVVIVLLAAFLAALAISTRLVVDSEVLAFWSMFRKKAIPWSDVQGFTVGVAKSYGSGWSCLVVMTGSGPVKINGVVGTKKFVQKKIAEIEDLRRRYVKP